MSQLAEYRKKEMETSPNIPWTIRLQRNFIPKAQ